MCGLANNKTSLGEVFRREIDCFKSFSNPDVFDLQEFAHTNTAKIDLFPQYKGPFNHDIKYFHPPFGLYNNIKKQTNPLPRDVNKKKIGYFVWESSELHQFQQEVLQDFDEIWTASHYCKDIFSQYIDEKLIRIIPHPIVFPKKPKKYAKFTILIIGNISSNIDRKNFEANLKVAKIISKKYKNINIILKTTTFNSEEKKKLKELVAGYRLKIIDDYLSIENVQKLIGKCHMILSLHRSEGFGLTLAEALSVGTIPVATGYSGNLEFMKNKETLVDYTLVDVKDNYFKGQWAEPNIDDCIDKIDNIIKRGTTIDSIQFLSYSNISKLILETLQND